MDNVFEQFIKTMSNISYSGDIDRLYDLNNSWNIMESLDDNREHIEEQCDCDLDMKITKVDELNGLIIPIECLELISPIGYIMNELKLNTPNIENKIQMLQSIDISLLTEFIFMLNEVCDYSYLNHKYTQMFIDDYEMFIDDYECIGFSDVNDPISTQIRNELIWIFSDYLTFFVAEVRRIVTKHFNTELIFTISDLLSNSANVLNNKRSLNYSYGSLLSKYTEQIKNNKYLDIYGVVSFDGENIQIGIMRYSLEQK